MIKIAIGGQMEKQNILQLIEKSGGGNFQATIAGDMDAALSVKRGNADYYFGCCETGGGGSLAGAIAIIGYGKCATISMPGKMPKKEDIAKKLQEGKVAFGFVSNHVDIAVPMLLEEIAKAKGEVN